jgi:broad specificity phosphatase PhoE
VVNSPSTSAARVVLVRHARPAATWGSGNSPDPGLDDTGREQAAAMARALAPSGPLPMLVSPMARTRETAAPLADLWAVAPTVEAAVGELRAPADPGLDHVAWLRDVMRSTYAELPAELRAFRDRVVERVSALTTDTVVVTHYLAINALVGAASSDDRVVSFAPAHCSRTVVEVASDGLRLVELGATGDGGRIVVDPSERS